MTVDTETQTVVRIVEDLLDEYKRRALEYALRRQPDHPLDREAIENLMVVLQDLEMLASLRKNLAA